MPQVHAGKNMINYIVEGEGSPIVLLHGIGSSSKSFHRQLKAFSEKHKVIVWDAPGFGESADPTIGANSKPSIKFYVECLRVVLDDLGLAWTSLLGHSLGGVIAQEFYREHPKRVRSLIISDTTRGGGAEPVEVRKSRLDNRLRMIRTREPAELARERAPKLLSPGASKDLKEEAVAIMSEIRKPGYEFAAMAIAEADTRTALDGITIPLLMIWGSLDDITPPWRSYPEKAKVEIIPNAGHLCYAEQPERFNSIVLDFLNA